MAADLFQVEITILDAPATTEIVASLAMQSLGVEYDHIEPEDPESGIWLVGLLGKHADTAYRGDEVYVRDGDTVLIVPQP